MKEKEGIKNKVAGKKARGMKNVLSLPPSVGWRNTAWLAMVNTEPATTTTNHRLPGARTHPHTHTDKNTRSQRQCAKLSPFCSLFMDTQ